MTLSLSIFFVITVILLLMMRFKYNGAWPVLLVTVIWTVVALQSPIGDFINQAVTTVLSVIEGVFSSF